MKNNEVCLWTVATAIIGGIVLFFALNNNQITISSVNSNLVINQASTTTNSTNIDTATLYTLSDLSKHNNQTNCWTLVDGKIYDISSFVSSHPAGVSKILKGCGVDATQIYGRVGAHDISRLTNFVVGVIK